MGFGHMFHGLWERLGGQKDAPAAEAASSGVNDTHRRLEDALEQLNNRVVSYKKSHDIADTKDYTAAEVADREAIEVKANQDAMMFAILKEHERLQTGLTADRIAVVAARMENVAERAAAVARSMAERIDDGARMKALQETGILAWTALEERMARHGVQWPEPSGLGHAPTPERIAKVRQMEGDRMRKGFLGTRPSETADMAQGLVRVWKTVYPEPDSHLYASTALQGVGAGLWCFYAAVTQALALRNRAALEAKADEILSSGLSKLSELLASSPEIDPALQTSVKFRAQEIVADVIPGMVWAELAPQVSLLVPGEEADRLLAETSKLAEPA